MWLRFHIGNCPRLNPLNSMHWIWIFFYLLHLYFLESECSLEYSLHKSSFQYFYILPKFCHMKEIIGGNFHNQTLHIDSLRHVVYSIDLKLTGPSMATRFLKPTSRPPNRPPKSVICRQTCFFAKLWWKNFMPSKLVFHRDLPRHSYG